MSFQLNNLMKQAQEMQKRMQQAQKEIEESEETGESGAGAVKITLNGKYRVVKKIELDPSLSQENIEVVLDLIAAAFNSGVQKIEEASKQKLSAITAGIQLPEGFGGGEGG
jgi:DNA-binding YbaB/EbfC family protein